jgi:hypothetical protein
VPSWSGPKAKSYVCSAHFTNDCFKNYSQFLCKLSDHLVLINGSVPTIHSDVQAVETVCNETANTSCAASTSAGSSSDLIKKSMISKYTQCDFVTEELFANKKFRKSVKTQTDGPPLRSIGIYFLLFF